MNAAAVRTMVDELFLSGIRWRFPRDRSGAGLAKRLQVLLHECRPPAHPSQKVTDLLLRGEIVLALAASGVSIDRGTARLLSGLPDCFALREYTDKWVTNTVALLTTAAPWRWRDAVGPRDRPHRTGNLGGGTDSWQAAAVTP